MKHEREKMAYFVAWMVIVFLFICCMMQSGCAVVEQGCRVIGETFKLVGVAANETGKALDYAADSIVEKDK